MLSKQIIESPCASSHGKEFVWALWVTAIGISVASGFPFRYRLFGLAQKRNHRFKSAAPSAAIYAFINHGYPTPRIQRT
jgi:hypothetical protein